MNSRILIVDDEPNVRLSYRVTLETDGYAVQEAISAANAMECLRSRKFELAILDMRMPGMDGLDLLAEIRHRGSTLPVIIVTAYGDIPYAVRAMQLGAIDFLQKPLTPQDLRKVVTEVLNRHAAQPVIPEPDLDRFETHLTAAKRLMNLQEFGKAKEHLIRALEINTDSAEAFNLSGVLFEMQQDFDRAKTYYGQAIRIDRHYEPAQQNMRRIFELFHFGSSDKPFHFGST